MEIVLFKKKMKIRTIILLAFIAFMLIYAIVGAVALNIEYMEYQEIGENFTDVFWTNLSTKALLMLISFFVVFMVFFVTNIFVNKGLKQMCFNEHIMFSKMPNKTLSFIAAVILSFAFASTMSEEVLLFLNSVLFNLTDPIFMKDISYFVFQRPLVIELLGSLSALMVIITAYTICYYLYGMSKLALKGITKNTFTNKVFVMHNFVNIGIFLLICAFSFAISVEGLVFSNFLDKSINGTLTSLVGAGFIDVNISRYVYLALPVITIICIIIAALFIRKGNIKKTVIALAVLPAVLILHGLVVGVVDTFFVSPNELDMEREYISYNMKYTKEGYNLDVDEKYYDVTTDISLNEINDNMELIDNARILDYKATLKVLNQYQTIRGYYTFNDVDIAVYDVDGEKKAVFIAARELNEDQLKDKSYVLKRFQYTHGYGITASSVNSIDENGYPNYILKDIIADYSQEDLMITQPRIYYGELLNEHVVVNANNIKEFDYPTGESGEQEYMYEGDSGIDLTLGNRILMALKYSDPKLIYSQYIANDSSLLINRNIIERANKVAPFFEYDSDPYLVITAEGKLIWVLDAYTTTTNYPYSQMTYANIKYANGSMYSTAYNYIRNSVKVIIDAYDGTTKFYIIDQTDPIAMAYYNMYPSLFENIETGLSDEIWSHVRFPEYLYKVQVNQLLAYHVDNVEMFYRNEDVWQISTHNNGTREEVMDPYYGLTVLDEKLEFALMQQFTPNNRSNLIAWLAAKSNKDEYGKIQLYKFNTERNILGTIQFDNQINQNADISKDLNLWSTGGSSIIRSMTIVPVGDSLLYIEPIYLAASNSSQIPAIKKIIVSDGKNLAMADTFEQALEKLLNERIVTPGEGEVTTEQDIIKAIIETNIKLKNAMQNSNWEDYGRYMQDLNDLIEQLEIEDAKK